MGSAQSQSPAARIGHIVCFAGLFWLAHALGYFTHEYAHSFTAWAFGCKANPFALNYGHLDLSNVLTQSDIDENVDYDPIFAAGRHSVAALIAIAGVLFGNGIFYLIAQYGYRATKSAGRYFPALFFFLLSIMNVGNLIAYIPARTFATHADMATVEQGWRISPWCLVIVLGIPFCAAVAHFVAKTMPEAAFHFFPQSTTERALLTIVSCFMIFVFYGGAGLHRYGAVSHAISMVSIWILCPLSVLQGWLRTWRS